MSSEHLDLAPAWVVDGVDILGRDRGMAVDMVVVEAFLPWLLLVSLVVHGHSSNRVVVEGSSRRGLEEEVLRNLFLNEEEVKLENALQ